jgi:hypothetical protein
MIYKCILSLHFTFLVEYEHNKPTLILDLI